MTWGLFYDNKYLTKHLAVADYQRLDLTPKE